MSLKKSLAKNFAGTASFEEMGRVLFLDPSQGIKIHAGQIYEARTVKGHTNLIVTMRVVDGWMVYMHADKAKKVKLDSFVHAVAHGDLQPRRADEIDTERLSMVSIGLDAIANRRTGEEMIEFYGDGAAERYYSSNGKGASPLVDVGAKR